MCVTGSTTYGRYVDRIYGSFTLISFYHGYHRTGITDSKHVGSCNWKVIDAAAQGVTMIALIDFCMPSGNTPADLITSVGVNTRFAFWWGERISSHCRSDRLNASALQLTACR